MLCRRRIGEWSVLAGRGELEIEPESTDELSGGDAMALYIRLIRPGWQAGVECMVAVNQPAEIYRSCVSQPRAFQNGRGRVRGRGVGRRGGGERQRAGDKVNA